MGASIIYGLDLFLHLRWFTLAHFDMYFIFFIFLIMDWDFRTTVCILVI
jgi:hypothetical protein